ncbi:MAG: beta-ketoacyl synthase N-terminal-like domain-containing protein, partial [Planctomycetota bacterium]|nr:beta-ketoacyl synthase N-terminal-like domain-containing protein [Planctomycetota bacterium]
AAEYARALGMESDGADFDSWVDALCDGLGAPLNANRVIGNLGGIVASRVAREFGLGGPSYVLSSEESSGLTALTAAVRGLALGDLSAALVGAVDQPSDVRAGIATDGDRSYERDGRVRPFDRGAAGTLPGDGAACVILKRRRDAERDGDRIYATVCGIGSATGGEATALLPDQISYRRALREAYAEAGISPASVDYLAAHGRGDSAEDQLEAKVLGSFFGAAVLGSAVADVGHTGAASGLISVVKAVLGLHHRVLPPLRGLRNRRSGLGDLLTPEQPQYWLRDDGCVRCAGVSSISVTGACYHVILQEDAAQDRQRPVDLRPLGPRSEHLLIVEGADLDALRAGLEELAKRAAETDIHALASLWWQEHGQDPDAALAVAIVCRDSMHLQRLCAAAIPALGQADPNLLETSGRRVFFSPEPLGRSGEVAFVYPGSGSHYPGMGRELAVQWPQLLRAQEAACTRLRAQLVPELIWNGDAAALDCEPRRLILAQVALGTLATDLVRSLGVQPAAVIGYSLGETAGLFSLGAWRERDEMLRRVMVSDLFTEQLTGPCLAARKTWALPEDEPVDWVLGVVDRSSEHVDAALASLPRAYRLIINTPDECVIGGQRGQVEAAVQAMQASFHQLHAVTTVHCEVAQAVKQAYYDLHILPTDEDVPVRFYSGEAGCSYQLSQTGAAASVANQALFGVDYPKVVRQAFDDGVRIFLEMGPGSSCTRMIRKILADESVAVRSVCANGQDGVSAILRTLAMLVAERAQVDLSSLYEDPVVPDPPGPSVRVRVGSPKLCPPALTGAVVQTTQAPVRVETPGRSQPIPVGGPVEASIAPDASWSAQSSDSVRGLAAANAEAVAAHDSYLRVAQQTTALLSQQIQTQFELIEQLQGGAGSGAVPSLSTVSFEAVPDRVSAAPPPLFDRDMCMEIATGSIAKVLGPDFEAVDTHPTRVRLPDEPLMLVDRILSIEGEARSMTHGKIVTEHDVLPGKWYLDNGRIPTCIAVEAGQADLFLSGYLGIDFETRGLAVYRLLDAVVTFHDQLPGVGKTIHYEIQIKEFFRQGDTWLFRFEFEATVDGCPLITMKEGCAGFFTQGELDAGQGIVESRMEQQARGAMVPGEVVPFAPMELQSLDEIQIAALRSGDLGAAFGPAFAGLPIANPLTLPTGNMELVHRVREINPSGGRYGIGSITAEADIHPDDWFLTCHFSDDMVMPGTLMYECCLHTLRIYLLRMGWVADAAEVVYQPVLGVRSRLKCRGQVLPGTRRVTYEVSIKQLGYGPEPFAVVDSLMYADDKPIVEINDMSVRLTGATREYLERVWREQVDEPASVEAPTILYDSESILAFSSGKPSQAFGAPYEIFDSGRKIARLPRPPFQFLDRITGVQGVAFEMKAGASCRAEVDITPDQWYFESNRQEQIPFAILLEMALQPCGWLAAYVGSALTSDEDLKFRNLGGESTQHTAVLPTTDTLVTEVEMTGVSSSAGMIIQHYRYRMTRRAGELVYDGTTYFGFFSHQALADQVGIRDAELHEPDDGELSRAETFEVPRVAPFADETMRMVDYIDIYVPDGGPDGLGFVRGTIDVDPSMWFFDAHFYQDPVWPGSLGLEAFLQVLKVIASRRWQLDDSARFATMPAGHSHSWSYRGQVVPSDNQVTIQACVKAVDDDLRTLVAEGFLSVDGRVIYQMQDFPLQVLP